MVNNRTAKTARQFSAGKLNDDLFVKEKAKAEKARAEHMGKLRDLRLAKEAAEAAAKNPKS